MKLYDREPYSWYVRECRESIFDAVEPSGNPEHSKTSGRNPRKITAYINTWYMKGLIDEIFNIAWDDFLFQVMDGWNPGRYRSKRIIRWSPCCRTGCEFRGYTHYVRDIDHEPKNRDDSWREFKRYRQDKSKHAVCWKHRSRGSQYKQFCKTQGAREHRQWVRQQLAHQEYDRFSDREYLEFADPWRWD